ncbi:hypothetical protein CASFOL_019661 [Castilleja foliolosa]|uniref:Uncharacterized protein n=1 Tax=Castilleja foliolosa TaxID=1961234 RepID=A0ABD3D5U4_9LAMI
MLMEGSAGLLDLVQDNHTTDIIWAVVVFLICPGTY